MNLIWEEENIKTTYKQNTYKDAHYDYIINLHIWRPVSVYTRNAIAIGTANANEITHINAIMIFDI